MHPYVQTETYIKNNTNIVSCPYKIDNEETTFRRDKFSVCARACVLKETTVAASTAITTTK